MSGQLYFYDAQIRRYLLQLIRMFSLFQVESIKNGETSLLQVPVKYGDPSRMAAAIIRDNSENKVISAPMITIYIDQLTYLREQINAPTYVDKRHIIERKFDHDTQQYTTARGDAFTIERAMPAPYKLTIKVDMWTTNTEQKLQLLEQILSLFNPSLEIQNTDNYLDWTSLSALELTDVSWTGRSIPQGTEDQIDVASLTFEMPIWITPPAKVKKLGVVEKICTNIFDGVDSLEECLIGTPIVSFWCTPMNYGILLVGGIVEILDEQQVIEDANMDGFKLDVPVKAGENKTTWRQILNQSNGTLRNGISQLRVTLSDDTEIVGTISSHPTDDFKLLFTVDTDTIPTNTLSAVAMIIDPLKSGPDSGLPAATIGTRYLILDDIGKITNQDGPDAWDGTDGSELVASVNDIIEYDGVRWHIFFDASTNSTVQYVTNTNTLIQYKWTGTEWVKSWEGEFKPGFWSLVL